MKNPQPAALVPTSTVSSPTSEDSLPNNMMMLLDSDRNRAAVTSDILPLPTPGFEGPEKRLEMDFACAEDFGLRELPSDVWYSAVANAKAEVLSVLKNGFSDAYLLSESSLFVFHDKLVMKTCGTTTLIAAVAGILEAIRPHGIVMESLWYSHRSFNYPHCQPVEHASFEAEVATLNTVLGGPPGVGYVLGRPEGEQFHMYVHDVRGRLPHHPPTLAIDPAPRAFRAPDVTLEVLMADLDPAVMNSFYASGPNNPSFVDAATTTKVSGIADLMPGATIDAWSFEPCGYSLNALRGSTYWTMHITPESHCSYVSFETNLALPDYSELILKVLALFRPRRALAVVFADDDVACGTATAAFTPSQDILEAGFKALDCSSLSFQEGPYRLAVWSLCCAASKPCNAHAGLPKKTPTPSTIALPSVDPRVSSSSSSSPASDSSSTYLRSPSPGAPVIVEQILPVAVGDGQYA